AGETPSPEMVAAAGVTGELSRRAAWSLFAAGVVAVVLCYVTAALWTVPGLIRGAKSRDVLADRAREIIEAFGYPAPADEAIRFQSNRGYLGHLAAHKANASWSPRPTTSASPTHFVYRGGPRVLVPTNADCLVTLNDPPEVIPTMSTLVLDHRGRLRSFRIVPPEKALIGTATVYDWRRAFELAALDITTFRPVASEWVPRYGFDRRHAWTGVYPDERDIAIRVEAASLAGRPVSFRVIEPWTTPQTPAARQKVAYFAFGLITFIAFVGGAVIARRNHRRGRGDLRGARKIAAAVLIGAVLTRVLWMDHVVDLRAEWEMIVNAMSTGLMRSFTAFLLYLAVEPYVRRRWPRMLISWSRVVAGRPRDPLVSRDVMIGVSVAALTGATARSSVPVLVWLGWTDVVPTDPLVSARTRSLLAFFAGVPASFVYMLTATLVVLTILLIFAFVLRNYLASMIVTGVMIGAVFATGEVPLPANVFSVAIGLWVLHRFGAVAYSAMLFVQELGIRTPFTFELDAWYGPSALAVGLLLIAWLAVSFYWSLAGKPAFGAAALEDVPAT
ncbi:MAG: sulfite exporter TauE/SafE family protein, partial [Thermoanaerobaculia bacterium]